MREEIGVDLIYIIKKWDFEIPRTIYKRKGCVCVCEETGQQPGEWRGERTREKVSEVSSSGDCLRTKTSKVALSVIFLAVWQRNFSTPLV